MIKEFDVAYIKAEFEKKTKQFLIAAGAMATNIAAVNAPVDTGALKNSIAYEVKGDSVYVGSNLKYARIQEWRRGYLVKALDEMHRTGIMQLATRIFKW